MEWSTCRFCMVMLPVAPSQVFLFSQPVSWAAHSQDNAKILKLWFDPRLSVRNAALEQSAGCLLCYPIGQPLAGSKGEWHLTMFIDSMQLCHCQSREKSIKFMSASGKLWLCDDCSRTDLSLKLRKWRGCLVPSVWTLHWSWVFQWRIPSNWLIRRLLSNHLK